ncbi:MAG: hypothetical protein ACP5K1_07105 [Candidatus Bathyarchaeia archaeon]
MVVIAYTKKDCRRCKELKIFLDRHVIGYVEKDSEKPEVARQLLESDYATRNFYDDKGCIVITSIVNLDGE